MEVNWVNMGVNSFADLDRYTIGLYPDSKQDQSTTEVKTTLLNEMEICATIIKVNLKDYVQWKKPNIKEHLLYNSTSMKFPKRQTYRNKK